MLSGKTRLPVSLVLSVTPITVLPSMISSFTFSCSSGVGPVAGLKATCTTVSSVIFTFAVVLPSVPPACSALAGEIVHEPTVKPVASVAVKVISVSWGTLLSDGI